MKDVKSPLLVAFLQSIGLIGYISLVAVIFWKGNEWFPKMNSYIGPLIFLTLFSVSALICGLVVFGYPYTLWQKSKGTEALKVVIYTTVFIAVYIILAMIAYLY